jgi:hypothetical protein
MHRRTLGTATALLLIGACSSESTISLLRPSEGLVLGDAGGIGLGEIDHSRGTIPLDPASLDALRNSACVDWSAAPEPKPSVLMLVVDVSGSMNDLDPSSTADATKWQTARPALAASVELMPSSAALGILYYPNQPTVESSIAQPVSECINTDALIPIAPLETAGSPQRTLIADSFSATEPVNSATPTHDAFNVAFQVLRESSYGGERYVLLMTDGQPTFAEGCIGTGRVDDPVDESPIIQAIFEARGFGIGTFVIGSPGSEETPSGADARPWLSFAAEAGGTSRTGCSHDGPVYCHFDMVAEPNFGNGLNRALHEIVGAIVPCAYPLPAPPDGLSLDPGRVNVVLTPPSGGPLLLLQSRDPACIEGWRYSADGRELVLCDATCSAVQSEAGASVELLIGCDSFETVR